MNSSDFLDAILPAYLAEMGPNLGYSYMDRFVARNRSKLLRMLDPLMAVLNEQIAVEEDPDAVTPEKDAIVWEAFMGLVEEKKRQLGARPVLEERAEPQAEPVQRKARKPKEKSEPVDPESLKQAILHDSLSEKQRAALRNIILTDPAAALRVAAISGHEASIHTARSATRSLSHLKLDIEPGDLRHAWMVAMQAIDPVIAKTNTINHTDNVPPSVLERIGLDQYEQEAWRRLFRGATDTAIEEIHHGTRPTLDEDVMYWSRVVGRKTALAALNMKPTIEELLPTGKDELSFGIKKWLAAGPAEITESLRRRVCSAQEAEKRGANPVYNAEIADAGLTAAWRGMTESMPVHGDFDPRDWSAQRIIASTMRWEPHDHLYYELLSVRPDATSGEIYRAWRAIQQGGDPIRPMKLAERMRFMLRKQAYDVLSNADWRKDYDAHGNLDASFRGLRRRVAEATTMTSSGDAISDSAREVLLAVNDMGPEAYAAHSGRGLPDLVALLTQTLHEIEGDDVKYRLPSKTESLPSPKHVGRKGDGFQPGEHVIRIGDMIKMEGQLGGYVQSVDRSRGTAQIEQDNGETKSWPIASLLHDTRANREKQQAYSDDLNG